MSTHNRYFDEEVKKKNQHILVLLLSGAMAMSLERVCMVYCI